MGTRRSLTFTVCIRDDDAKVFEFRATSDIAGIATLVKAAAGRGRSVRCDTLAADPSARARLATIMRRVGQAARTSPK